MKILGNDEVHVTGDVQSLEKNVEYQVEGHLSGSAG